MGRRLLIATGNQHKVSEIRDLLSGMPVTVLSLSDYPSVEEPVEDGDTFEANAAKKARYYCEQFGVACVADDSGLVVDALGGAPGVLSARYAGRHGDDAANNERLLRELADVAAPERTARFMCCAVLALPSGELHSETGAVEGRIDFVCKGDNGFGYDPLFVPDGYSRSFGELDSDVKQRISHRAAAFGKLRSHMESAGWS